MKHKSSSQDFLNTPGYKLAEIIASGKPGVLIECPEDIPCNPCETACKFGVIKIGEPITNLPGVDLSKCTGCKQCVADCPGQAVFIVHPDTGNGRCEITFPYEFLPYPQKGQTVQATDRDGEVICDAVVENVDNSKKNDLTAVITISIPKEHIDAVRGMRKL